MRGINLRTEIKPLTEIADIERVQKNKIYPMKTIYVQVSACKKNSEYIWYMLNDSSILEDKYAVIVPKIDIIPEYLVVVLERVTLRWMHKYVGSSINISMDLFKYLEVEFHISKEMQKFVLSILEPISEEIKLIEERIEKEQAAKKIFCKKMMP
ncbi:MAG: hypothetical protein IJS61_01250 [Firmicutes bacterium]|nr:hypothetical protein [Bacillota bacterium]